MAEEYDATFDSDDEADYTKMDMVGVAFLVLYKVAIYDSHILTHVLGQQEGSCEEVGL